MASAGIELKNLGLYDTKEQAENACASYLENRTVSCHLRKIENLERGESINLKTGNGGMPCTKTSTSVHLTQRQKLRQRSSRAKKRLKHDLDFTYPARADRRIFVSLESDHRFLCESLFVAIRRSLPKFLAVTIFSDGNARARARAREIFWFSRFRPNTQRSQLLLRYCVRRSHPSCGTR